MKIMEHLKTFDRLKSRKLWVTLVGGLLFMLNDALGLNIDADTQQNLALLISSYLLGQSAVDWAKARENADKYAAWVAAQAKEVTKGGSTRNADL